MSKKEAEKNWILIGIVVLAFSFGMIGSVGAHIEIRDLGIEEMENVTGFVDFKNEVEDIFLEECENYNVTGVIRVYNNETLVYEENITLEVVSFHGFAVNRPETREFEINTTVGLHNLTTYIESDGEMVEEVYKYEMYEQELPEEEELGEEEDWLLCP